MFNILKKKIKVITHNGDFHVDDIFAVATLQILLGEENVKVVRTRDEKTINSGDFVADVGGIYDEEKNRFDHHQEGGAGERENGVPYSSFGLIWKKYGEKISDSKEASRIIDEKLVQPIDAMDNGVNIYKSVYKNLYPYIFQDIKNVFKPTWKEDFNEIDKNFLEIVKIAKRILEREIIYQQHSEEAKEPVQKAYEEAEDKRIIILNNDYPWEEILNKPEPLYVVKPRPIEKNWVVKVVRSDNHSFASRKDLPESWAGKRGEELAKITGVETAKFCHIKRWMIVAGTKEDAIKLAKIALDS